MKLIRKLKNLDNPFDRTPKWFDWASGTITKVVSCDSGWQVSFGNSSGVILPYNQMYDCVPKVGHFLEIATIRATEVVGCKLNKELIYLLSTLEILERDICHNVYYKITYESLV